MLINMIVTENTYGSGLLQSYPRSSGLSPFFLASEHGHTLKSEKKKNIEIRKSNKQCGSSTITRYLLFKEC